MKQVMKKLFCMTLCALFLLSLLPAQVLAAQQDVGNILWEAFALEEGASLPYAVTLTGIITTIRSPYDPNYCNITVEIQIPDYEMMPVQCYRLSGAGAESLTVGDIITVTGYLFNYRGTIEFMQGCTLDAVSSNNPTPPAPELDAQRVVDAAYQLAPGEALPYLATLTGTVTEIVTPYDENYMNITVMLAVEGREHKPITCYRMRGDGTQWLQQGNVITVQGTIQNYAKYDNDTGELLYTTVEFYLPTLVDIQRDTQKLYCYAPMDWTQCYAYCWSDEGYTVGQEWPGVLMTEENVSLWSFEMSADADYIVFNNGSSDDHTGDLTRPVNDEILYVVDNGTWELLEYYDIYPPFDDGWGPDSLALVGDGLPGIPVWYPEAPEGDMKQVSTNVYEKILQVPAGSHMMFKIAGNDCWDDQWNFGCGGIEIGRLLELECGGGSQNMDLTVNQDCTLRFTVDLNPMLYGENATLLVEELNPPVTYRNLTVYAPESVAELYAYTWNDELLGPFPGQAMAKVGDHYELMVPDTMVNLSLLWEDGANAWMGSTPIALDTNGMDVNIHLNENGSYSLRYINLSNHTYRVVGSAPWMGSWYEASDLGKMQQLSAFEYEKIFRNVQPGCYEFKITVDGKWDNAIGNFYGNNCVICVEELCDVSVTLTFLGDAPVVKVEPLRLLVGDVTGDGVLNLGDIAKLYAHIRGSSTLTDEKALLRADFTGDGILNLGDTAGLYAYIRCTDKTAIVDAAYRLEHNEQLPLDHTLTGTVIEVVEPYDPAKKYITVRMTVDGRENYPIFCSRLTGEEVRNITLGDRITVTGRLSNFYGIVEFKEGCRLENWEEVDCGAEVMQHAVDEAYALGINETMDRSVTLEGRVISIEQYYAPQTPFVSLTIVVEGREDKPIFCYRLVGASTEWVEVGDTVTVTGTLRNYSGTVEFAAGCQLGEEWILD